MAQMLQDADQADDCGATVTLSLSRVVDSVTTACRTSLVVGALRQTTHSTPPEIAVL